MRHLRVAHGAFKNKVGGQWSLVACPPTDPALSKWQTVMCPIRSLNQSNYLFFFIHYAHWLFRFIHKSHLYLNIYRGWVIY